MSRLNRLVKRVASSAGIDVRVSLAKRRIQMLNHYGIDCFVDVGASRGQTGRELRRFGYTGTIVSFEPLSSPYAELQEAARDDAKWLTRNEALGNEVGEVAFNVSANEDSSSVLRVLERSVAAEPATQLIRRESVRMVRLDDIAGEVLGNSLRPFLKADVQGSEAAVLAGATESLRRFQGLQLEVSLVPLYSGAPAAHEIVQELFEQGFDLRGVEPGFLDPATGEQLQVDLTFLRQDLAPPS